jgi:hypothetical protein
LLFFSIKSDDGQDLWNAINNAQHCDKVYQYKVKKEDFIIKHFEMSKLIDQLKLEYRKKFGFYY